MDKLGKRLLYGSPWEERFWFRVDRREDDECWYWLGSTSDGYGHLGVRQANGKWKGRTTHQLSWEIHYGPIPKPLYVLHLCHHRSCVNPEHLYLGDQKQDIADSIRAGTHRFENLTLGPKARRRSIPL